MDLFMYLVIESNFFLLFFAGGRDNDGVNLYRWTQSAFKLGIAVPHQM
jgi:hypothetical protein